MTIKLLSGVALAPRVRRTIIPGMIALITSVLAAVVCAPAPASDSSSIYDTLASMKDHTILSVAIKEAGEVGMLNGTGGGSCESECSGEPPKIEQAKYTLFAPPDSAFKKLDDATIKQLATDRAAVKRLVRAHLVVGKLTVEDLKKLDGKEIRTLQGGALKVENPKDGLRVGGAKIATANVQCSNGVIHVIDAVLPVAKE
jgi:hypothetical protein